MIISMWNSLTISKGFNAVRIYLIFRKIRREKTEPLSMSWGLIYTQNFKATDHRDKIYAVMNIAEPGLQPDKKMAHPRFALMRCSP